MERVAGRKEAVQVGCHTGCQHVGGHHPDWTVKLSLLAAYVEEPRLPELSYSQHPLQEDLAGYVELFPIVPACQDNYSGNRQQQAEDTKLVFALGFTDT